MTQYESIRSEDDTIRVRERANRERWPEQISTIRSNNVHTVEHEIEGEKIAFTRVVSGTNTTTSVTYDIRPLFSDELFQKKPVVVGAYDYQRSGFSNSLNILWPKGEHSYGLTRFTPPLDQDVEIITQPFATSQEPNPASPVWPSQCVREVIDQFAIHTPYDKPLIPSYETTFTD